MSPDAPAGKLQAKSRGTIRAERQGVSTPTVLVLGATGRTGQAALRQLLDRGVAVRAIVRSPAKLAPELARHPAVTLVEASLLDLGDEELRRHVRGCDAVVSCLGHVISLRGIFGRPRDLVTQAMRRVCRAIEEERPPSPVTLVLMGSVSVNHPDVREPRRTAFERAFLAVLRALVPPARDNQRAATFLAHEIGDHPSLRWVVIRPDTLREGGVTEYALHETLVDGLFKPGETNIANVAHFMGELVTNPTTCAAWRGKLPVIVNRPAAP